MRDTIKGCVIGALVAAGVSVLLAQSATWTTPRTWATADLLTASDFNSQFRDNLLWLRQDAQLTGTDALEDLGCGTLGTNEVLFSDCSWATIPAGVVFDLHDDVGTAETIVDLDRMVFSDEGSAGDPMRFSTAANLADYMQGEVELSANRVTSDTFNEARLGTGTASISNVLKGGSGTTAAWGPVSVDPDDIDATNTPSDGDLPFYDSSSGEVTWQPIGFDTADFSDHTGFQISSPSCPDIAGGSPGTSVRPIGGLFSQGSVSVLATTLRPVLHYDVTIFQQTTFKNMSLDISSQSSAQTVLAVPTFMSGDPRIQRLTGTSSPLDSGPWVFNIQRAQAVVYFCNLISSVWVAAT